MKKIKKLMKSQKMTCENCEYYITNYKDFEDDIPYNRCNHPKLDYSLECYDFWLATNPNDFCSYFTAKGMKNKKRKKIILKVKNKNEDEEFSKELLQKIQNAPYAPYVRYRFYAKKDSMPELFDYNVFDRLKTELMKQNNKSQKDAEEGIFKRALITEAVYNED